MDDRASDEIFVKVLVQQLEFAAFAFDEVQAEWLRMDEIMRRVYAFLSHAAFASRVLWPTPGRGAKGEAREARGIRLRELLNIQEQNPLAQRNIRNTLEHFDEELDTLLVTIGSRKVVLQSVNGEPTNDPEQPLVFRDYDVSTSTMWVLGESQNLGMLREAIQDVGEEAYRLLNKWYAQRERFYPENRLGTFPERREL